MMKADCLNRIESMNREFVTRAMEDVWEEMQFRNELIESQDRLEWWEKNVFNVNADLDEGVSKTAYADARSALWIKQAAGECELYLCWLEYRGQPCIAVPMYIHMDIAMVQGIRRFHNLTPVPSGAGRLGVHLLAEVCRHFAKDASHQLEYLFVCPIIPFKQILIQSMQQMDVKFDTHHAGTLLDFRGPNGEKRPDVDPSAWLQREEEPEEGVYVYSIVRPDLYHEGDSQDSELHDEARVLPNSNERMMHRKELGILEKPGYYVRWDVFEQKWVEPIRKPKTVAYDVIVTKGYAPYNFLMGLSGSDKVLIIDAHSLAEQAAFAWYAKPPPYYAAGANTYHDSQVYSHMSLYRDASDEEDTMESDFKDPTMGLNARILGPS